MLGLIDTYNRRIVAGLVSMMALVFWGLIIAMVVLRTVGSSVVLATHTFVNGTTITIIRNTSTPVPPSAETLAILIGFAIATTVIVNLIAFGADWGTYKGESGSAK